MFCGYVSVCSSMFCKTSVMKLNFTFLFVFSFLTLTAQMDVVPEMVEVSGVASETIETSFDINNEGQGLTALWRMVRNEIPDEWQFSLCDLNTCYDYGQEECPSDNPNEFASGQKATFDLKCKPNGVTGSGELIIEFFNPASPETVLNSFTVVFTATSTSVSDFDIELMSIFPNPTSEKFSITADDRVKQVSLFNIIGKEIATYSHKKGNSYDISSIQNGMYIVRLFDAGGNNIKVIRLSKR